MTGLLITRLALSVVAAGLTGFLAYDIKRTSKVDDGEIALNEYETLFHKLGIIKADKGDTIEFIGKEDRPCYTLTTLKVSTGVKLEKILSSIDSLRTKLDAPRLEIEGKGEEIYLKNIKTDIAPKYFKIEPMGSELIPIGTDDEQEIIYWDVTKDPSTIMGGVPGCGKSSLLNMMIIYLLETHEAELYLIDLKGGIEFGPYEGCGYVKGYAEEEAGAKKQINSFFNNMEERLKVIRAAGCKNYEQYLEKNPDTDLKRQFLFIDEFADLMTKENVQMNEDKFGKTPSYGIDVLDVIKKIGRKGRAAGCHLVLASQRMTADSFPPTLKACISCIIGFKTANAANSELIIDHKGLERLDKREAMVVMATGEVHIRTMYLEDALLYDVIKKHKEE